MNDPEAIPDACIHHLSISPDRFLGGRVNQHWVVNQAGRLLILRAYRSAGLESVAYELDVLRRFAALGWPVPQPAGAPFLCGGRVWCLFTLLPGTAPTRNKAEDKKHRGRLLAAFHLASAALTDIGQRTGFQRFDAVLQDAGLASAIDAYAAVHPEPGHVLRWHLDQGLALLQGLDLSEPRTLIIHGDFVPWNLLFSQGRLTGVIDFEFAHRDVAVADFALSWRGWHDDIIDGYLEVAPLSANEMAMIVPACWAFFFKGMARKLRTGLAEGTAADVDWEISKFLLRSRFNTVEPYPGR